MRLDFTLLCSGMVRLSRRAAIGGALAASVLALAGSPAQALDPRFTDANGDMVADAPKDPKQWIDPPVLVFAYTPVEDPSVYAKVWDGFIKHMEKVTGKRVQFFPVQSNAAQLEAMRAGDDFSFVTRLCNGPVPFAGRSQARLRRATAFL
jgi:ABC-type phosphate/phosphonate transport system substrate-binding protein